MHLRSGRICTLFLLIAFLLGSGLFVWWESRPLATLVLSDGTKIFLRKITKGPKHFYSPETPPNASIWQKLKNRLNRPKATVDVSEDEYGFHFTAVKPGGREEAVASNFAIWPDDNHPYIKRHFAQWDGAGLSPASPPGSVSLYPLEDFSFWGVSVFPRREKSIPAGVLVNGQRYRFDLPNPAWKPAYPNWTADPLPIIRKLEDVEIRMVRLKSRGVPVFELSMAGQRLSADDFVIHKHSQSDPTGNKGTIPRSELVWRKFVRLEVGKQTPVSSQHAFGFGRITVPEDGSFIPLTVPAGLQKHGLLFAAFLGSGAFEFRDGIGTSIASNPSAPPSGPATKSWLAYANSKEDRGLILVVDDSADEEEWHFHLDHYRWRYADREAWTNIRRRARKEAGARNCRALFLPWSGMLAPGQTIEVQIVQSVMCDIEFFAARPESYPFDEDMLARLPKEDLEATLNSLRE